jgi:glycosyltransferase 2 family protein
VTSAAADRQTQPARAARRWAGLPQLLFVLVAAGAAGFGFADHLPAVLTGFADIGAVRSVIAAVLVWLGLLATAQLWRANLGALGHPLPTRHTHRVFFPAQVGKYLPGAVWPYVAQLRLIRQYGIPAGATLTASAMFLAVHVSTGIAFGIVLLAGVGAVAEQVWWSLLLLPPALTLLHPRVVTWIVGKLPSRLRSAEPVELRWVDLARPAGWMLLGWVAYGAAAFVVLTPFARSPFTVAVTAVGAFSVAWVVGPVAIIAPAGVGAREATFALLLAPFVGAVPAVAAALLLRLCHLVADVALAIWFGLLRTNAPRS